MWAAWSVLAYVTSAQLSYHYHDYKEGFLGENIQWLYTWRFRHVAWQVLRLVFYVLPPYALLIFRRAFSAADLGLWGNHLNGFMGWDKESWGMSLAWTIVAWIGGVGILGLVIWASEQRGRRMQPLFRSKPLQEMLWDGLFIQVHWAFLRASMIMLLSSKNPIWGGLAGLILIALEAIGDPAFQLDIRNSARAFDWIRLGLVAWISLFLFIATGNIWLCVGVQWGIVWGSSRVGLWYQRERITSAAAG